MKEVIGVIGLGNMGKEIAKRLASIYEVFGYDINDVNKTEVEECGVVFVDTLEKLSQHAKYIFISLPNAKVSKAVCEEIVGFLDQENILIETSTILPSDMKALEKICERNRVKIIDAAILGGVGHIKEGRADFLVGGDENAIKLVSEYLQELGRKINVIGEIGTGMAAKVINNGVAHNAMVLIIEAAAIGRKLGIGQDKILEILKGETTFDRPLTYRYEELVQNKNYNGGMSTGNAHKDSTLILELAQQLKVPLFSIQASQTVYDIAVNEQLIDLDYASIAILWEKWCGISFSGTDEKGA